MGEKLSAEKYASVRMKKLSWLWYPYIAFGKITLLQGDPGDGKSTFMLQLAALLSNGKNMPDGTRGKRPMNIIYQCNEDSLEDTIKPRLLAAGANLQRVFYIRDAYDLSLDDSRLEETIQEVHARLVIFDPIQSFIPAGADMVNAVKMRSILSDLSTTAEKCNCAIVLIGHLTKDSGGKDLYRLLGSIDIAATARSMLMIQRDDEDKTIRHLKQIKNNLGPEGSELIFQISKDTGFRWQQNIVRSKDISTLQRAKDMITETLKAEDVKSTEMLEKLKGLNISERTSRSAMKELGVTAYKKGKVWYWHYPEPQENKETDYGKNDQHAEGVKEE